MTIKCKECQKEFNKLKEASDHYNREHTPIGKLVKKFNEWADDSIICLDTVPPMSEKHRESLKIRIQELKFAKWNLERLFKEVINEV